MSPSLKYRLNSVRRWCLFSSLRSLYGSFGMSSGPVALPVLSTAIASSNSSLVNGVGGRSVVCCKLIVRSFSVCRI